MALSACGTEESQGNRLAQDYEIIFQLGSEEELTELFSYPNSEESSQTLEETVEHYLLQCVQRDLVINGTADVFTVDNMYHVTISGDSIRVDGYNETITTFLNNGVLAVEAVDQLKEADIWNHEEWRFFLPLGLSIVNHRSVQLLHFPPDYSLTEQDYLSSKTSQRWEELLMLNDVPSEEVTLYESILDIAPVAAPSNAGSTLEETYSYFEAYVVEMLLLLLDKYDGLLGLPIVAYGGPVRNWVSEFYQLKNFYVNTVDSIRVSDSVVAPILGANHPSYIWYAKDDSREKAFSVMEADLISACWQARMGRNPQEDSVSVLQQCKANWKSKPMTVCVNMEIQAYGREEPEAEQACKDDPPYASPKTEL